MWGAVGDESGPSPQVSELSLIGEARRRTPRKRPSPPSPAVPTGRNFLQVTQQMTACHARRCGRGTADLCVRFPPTLPARPNSGSGSGAPEPRRADAYRDHLAAVFDLHGSAGSPGACGHRSGCAPRAGAMSTAASVAPARAAHGCRRATSMTTGLPAYARRHRRIGGAYLMSGATTYTRSVGVTRRPAAQGGRARRGSRAQSVAGDAARRQYRQPRRHGA